MGNYNKTVIAPIVAVICLAVAGVFGVSIGDDVQATIVEAVGGVVAVGVTVYGIFKNHQKPPVE